MLTMINDNDETVEIDTQRREIPGTGGLHLLDGEHVLENPKAEPEGDTA